MFQNLQGIHSTAAPWGLSELVKELNSQTARGIGQQSPSKTSSISQDHTGLSASPDKDPPSNFLLGRMHKTCSWDLQVGSWGSEDKDAETCDF